MKKYKLLKLYATTSGIYIESGDSQTINLLLRELKKMISLFQIEWKEGLEKDQVRGCFIYMLRGKNEQVEAWLVDKLCEYGWEPYAVYETVDNMGTHHPAHCFRQVSNITPLEAKPFEVDDMMDYMPSN